LIYKAKITAQKVKNIQCSGMKVKVGRANINSCNEDYKDKDFGFDEWEEIT
jgi:hypothetical protein